MNTDPPFQQAIPRNCPTWLEAKRSEPELDAIEWITRVLEPNPTIPLTVPRRTDDRMETPKSVNVQSNAPRPADTPRKASERGDTPKKVSKPSDAQREVDAPVEASKGEEDHLNDAWKEKIQSFFLLFSRKNLSRGV